VFASSDAFRHQISPFRFGLTSHFVVNVSGSLNRYGYHCGSFLALGSLRCYSTVGEHRTEPGVVLGAVAQRGNCQANGNSGGFCQVDSWWQNWQMEKRLVFSRYTTNLHILPSRTCGDPVEYQQGLRSFNPTASRRFLPHELRCDPFPYREVLQRGLRAPRL